MKFLVDECVANILGQVRLLRQISSEFSSFATSPEPRPCAYAASSGLMSLSLMILMPFPRSNFANTFAPGAVGSAVHSSTTDAGTSNVL